VPSSERIVRQSVADIHDPRRVPACIVGRTGESLGFATEQTISINMAAVRGNISLVAMAGG
jgi:hypothetical protein